MVVGKTGIVVSPLVSLMQDQVIDYCRYHCFAFCENSQVACKLTKTLANVTKKEENHCSVALFCHWIFDPMFFFPKPFLDYGFHR